MQPDIIAYLLETLHLHDYSIVRYLRVALLIAAFSVTGCRQEANPLSQVTSDEPTCIAFRESPLYPPKIQDSYVVFSILGEDGEVIVGVDLETRQKTKIVLDEGDPGSPPADLLFLTVHGNWIVWLEHPLHTPPDSGELYAYNLTTSERARISKLVTLPALPALFGDTLVWVEKGPCPDTHITKCSLRGRVHNLRTGEELSMETAQRITDIVLLWNDYLVYNAYGEAGDLDIGMYDLTTGEERWLVTADDDQYLFSLQGSRVLYRPRREANEDFKSCVYNFATETTDCFIANTVTTMVWEKHVAWSIGGQVYLHDLDTGTTLQIAEGYFPTLNDKYLTWFRYSSLCYVNLD
jgi:hypothetical protein